MEKLISNIDQLSHYCQQFKEQQKKIVLVQGHFNVIHPGHLRFLEYAKRHGDRLIVALHGQDYLEPKTRQYFYSTQERILNISHIPAVDHIYVLEDHSLLQMAELARPDAFVLGVEFRNHKDQRIRMAVEHLEKAGATIIYHSGDQSDYILPLSPKEPNANQIIDQERYTQMIRIFQRQQITTDRLFNILKNIQQKKIVVIGDTIIDQYNFCTPLGVSSEAPVLVVKDLEQQRFIGGAAIVARHIRSLGAQTTFISTHGHDAEGTFLQEELARDGIQLATVVDHSRPTILKTRFMVEKQKIFRVSRLEDHPISKRIETLILEQLHQQMAQADAIVISDFNYGLLTATIIREIKSLAAQHDIKIFADSQSSSQTGDLLKYNHTYLVAPTEKEARGAIHDKYNGLEYLGRQLQHVLQTKNLILKVGPNGFIVFTEDSAKGVTATEHFLALNKNPLDVMGAGDALLAMLATAIAGQATLMEAAALGAITAALQVSKVGNIPIHFEELWETISSLKSAHKFATAQSAYDFYHTI